MTERSRHRLVRLEVVTPANLGSAAGETTLDRPTQKEAWHGLPYLPDSAFKGVLAGRYGNVPDAERNHDRERFFGSPDRGEERGRPSQVVFGNGELLAFPVPAAGGGRVWVYPALALARLLWLEGAAGDAAVLRLLGALESDRTNPDGRACAAWPAVPDLGPGWSWAEAPEAARARLRPLLRRYGGAGAGGGPWLVVAAASAGRLWQRLGGEVRTLTALDTHSHTVQAGSLRTVEQIPPGAVFLSHVTLLPGAEQDLEKLLPPHLQLGAWAAQGLGWVRLEEVTAETAVADGEDEKEAGSAAAATPAPAAPRLDRAAIMAATHRAVLDLNPAELALRKSAKAALDSFGGRARFGGFEAALAFELAKAKPAHARPKTDARAHRWLLATLLGLSPGGETGPAAELLAWAEGEPFSPESRAALEPLVFERWRWLRRFAEVDLKVKAETPPAGEGAA